MPRGRSRKVAQRRDAEFWRGVVAEWISSGASRQEICDRFDVNANTLSWWKWQLRDEDLKGVESPAPAAVEFLPVQVIAGAATRVGVLQSASSTLEIVLENDRRIRVAPGFDPEHLAQVVVTLEQLP